MSLLPPQPAPFVGRTHEIAEIRALLANPACRLLTLTGPGGIGKTRLALQVANDLMTAFSYGAAFVSLAALTTPDHIVSAIAETLEIHFYAEQPPQTQLCQYLHRKHLLLVLDNFEHLLDGAGLLPEILQATTDVKLLVTSRERLNLREEWLFEVSGLTVPASVSMTHVEEYSAVQLFVQNARQVDSDFALTPDNRSDAVRICQMVEGMPLGIELASAWVRVLPCADIVREIAGNLDVLQTSLRNVPERHRSIRAVFDHSWRLLTEDEQRVFSRLSVFRGGFTREAAEQVAGASLPTLAALVDKSLVQVSPDGRYSLHPLLHQYAAEQPGDTASESEEVQDRHASYYTGLMESHIDNLFKGPRTPALDREAENMRLAFLRSAQRVRLADVRRALEPLFYFYDRNGWYQEGYEAYRQVADTLGQNIEQASEDRLRLWAWSCSQQAGFLFHIGRYEEAAVLLQRSLDTLRPLEPGIELMFTLGWLGNHARRHIGLGPPRGWLEQAVELAFHMNFTRGKLWGSTDLVGVMWMDGQFAEARPLAHDALALCRQMNHLLGEVIILRSLSYITHHLGEQAESERWAQESLAAAEKLGFPRYLSEAHYLVGNMFYEREQYVSAKSHYQKGLEQAEESADLWNTGLCLRGLGIVASRQGDFRRARDYFHQALQLTSVLDTLRLTFEVVEAVATLLGDEGRPERAVEVLALVQEHPSSYVTAKRRAVQALAHLQADLLPDAFTAAVERGKQLVPEQVVQQLLDYVSQAVEETNHLRAAQSLSETADLTDRELEVLRLIADGLSSAGVAQQLFLGVGTVKWYLNQIYGKLHVHSRTQAVARARELNLLA